MPHPAWQKFCEQVRAVSSHAVCFDPQNSPYNKNPYAFAYPPQITISRRPLEPCRPSGVSDAGSSLVKDTQTAVECEACTCSKNVNQFPTGKITEHCSHEQKNVCSECLAKWIAAQFKSDPDQIACPICRSSLTSNDVDKYGSREIRDRFVAHLRGLENFGDFFQVQLASYEGNVGK